MGKHSFHTLSALEENRSSIGRGIHSSVPDNHPVSHAADPGPIRVYENNAQDQLLIDGARRLTSGETEMARLIFKDSINYAEVKVHNEEYLWFGMQLDNTAMTPNGEMYFNADYFEWDFSMADYDSRHWFMHEMVHVWQYQLGYPVKLRGAVRIGLDYTYTLEAGKRFNEYDMEAQGDIVADYFALKYLRYPPAVIQERYRFLWLVEKYENDALVDFLANPGSRSNLPGGQ